MAIMPEDPAERFLPFAPVGFYFLVSFYKTTWITQHTRSSDDVLKHFSESSYLDEKNFLYHSITDYVEVRKPLLYTLLCVVETFIGNSSHLKFPSCVRREGPTVA